MITMSMPVSEQLSSKKLRRLENKKRKIKAFLEIAGKNDIDRAARLAKKHQEESQHSSTDSDTSPDEMATHHPKRPRLDSLAVRDKDHSDSKSKNDVEETENVNRKRLYLPPDELQKLRAEVIARKIAKMQHPVLHLCDRGVNAEFQVNRDENHAVPLYVPDIQNLLIHVLTDNTTGHSPNWCRVLRKGKVSHTVLVIVEGISVEDFQKNAERFPRTRSIFPMMVEIVPPVLYGGRVSEEFLWVALSNADKKKYLMPDERISEAVKCGKFMPYSSLVNLFKIKNWIQSKSKSSEAKLAKVDRFPRTDLLLSPLQMILEGYPMTAKIAGFRDFVYTKDEYECVTPKSPLFGVDCEMCITTARKSELTRVSVVNEKMESIYDTLVKPYNAITNYLTPYSGITKEMMTEVTTRLEDVQKRFRELFPPDAILVGQSLNSDLIALKMIHPYVIDTSIIYNLSGIRNRKTGLKTLMKVFLNEIIQNDSVAGHDSIEDSSSALKLVLLKLQNEISFGDVIMGDDNLKPEPKPETSHTKPVVNHPVFSSTTGLVHSLLNLLARQEKKVTVIRSQEEAVSYQSAEKCMKNTDHLKTIHIETNKESAVHVCKEATNCDLTISHMKLNVDYSTNELTKLDKRLKRIHKSCAKNSMLLVVLGGTKLDDCDNIENGLCMLNLKV